MLAKKTTKNQITLPKKVVARFTGVEYFDVSTDGACIILRPLQKSRALAACALACRRCLAIGFSRHH
jgi:hypothetical protein